MHPRTLHVALVLSVAGGVCATLSAQSLADVARQEDARRKAITRPTRVVTNKDLGSVPASTPPPATSQKPAPGAGTPVAADKGAGDNLDKGKDAEKTDTDPAKGQAYWSGRMKDLQAQLDRNQILADALQTRVNSLLTDFVSRADPAQRSVIERDRQKAMGELEQVKQDIQKSKKAVADLQEEARRAGVPAGWLR